MVLDDKVYSVEARVATETLWPSAETLDRASRGARSMSTTNPTLEKRTADEPCEHDWCGGSTGNQLPCFACFEAAAEDERRDDAY